RDAMAVRITELRLWLAVIADDPARMPRRVRPLPNLDCLVRQGDSLLAPGGWMGQLASSAPGHSGPLAGLRRKFLIATGAEKAAAARELHREEHAVACRRAAWAESATDDALRQSVADARAPDLFGQPSRMTAAGRKEFSLFRRMWHSARAIRRQLHEDRAVPWFQYEIQFGDIVNGQGGFDLVIGNPPWVRAERLPARLRQHLSERYAWWRTAADRGMGHQPDLSIAFLERGLELASPDGIVAFLLPAKITSAGYAERARQTLRRKYRLHAVARLASEDEGAFTAAVYPLLLVAGNGRPSPGDSVAIGIGAGSDRVSVSDLPHNGPWVLRSAGLARLNSRFREMPRLGEHFRTRLGIKTGANAVFLDPAAAVEEEMWRPVLRGRDLARPESLRNSFIIWTHGDDGHPLTSLPPGATRWFNRHRRELTRRSDYRGGPIWQLFRTEGLQTPWRVVWADLAGTLRPIVTGNEVIPLNTCYYLACDESAVATALAAWLGSKWLRAAAALVADPARGGYARFNARCIEGLPWFADAVADPVLNANPDPEEIDDAVAGYLEISPAERRALGRVARRSPGGC
ncbi:MAG: Eco57I restriction-modification methylase domain-containing protein, partial [Gemmatimonadales bacterium]